MANSLSKNILKNKIILIPLSILIIVLFIIFTRSKPKYPSEIQLNINNVNYFLEVASTPKQREIGLSNRESICSNCGMLFAFPKQANRSFWMKDTLIPLDMIWLDKNYKVVKIATVLETNSEKTYKGNAKYVIELNANEVFKRDLKIGDSIQLPDFND